MAAFGAPILQHDVPFFFHAASILKREKPEFQHKMVLKTTQMTDRIKKLSVFC